MENIMNNTRRFLIFIVISMVLVFSGCTGTQKSRVFVGQITVSPDANPDHQGRASPVEVKIYQLKDIKSFQEADFFSLNDDGPKVLGSDLISVEGRELRPGVTYDYSAKVHPDTIYLGVLAAFRNIEKAQWRVTTKLPEKNFFDFMRRRSLRIHVTDDSVSSALFINNKF